MGRQACWSTTDGTCADRAERGVPAVEGREVRTTSARGRPGAVIPGTEDTTGRGDGSAGFSRAGRSAAASREAQAVRSVGRGERLSGDSRPRTCGLGQDGPVVDM